MLFKYQSFDLTGWIPMWRLSGEEQRQGLRGTDQHPEGQPGTKQNKQYL